MKKFQFSLETVLSYKQQILDTLQQEHAEAIALVHRQEELLEQLWSDYYAYAAEYRERCEEGLEITQVLTYQAGLRAREREIQQETQRLELLRKKEEEARMKVVTAKQETSSIEKLREKKLDSYNSAVAKSEERFVEDFVSAKRAITAQSGA